MRLDPSVEVGILSGSVEAKPSSRHAMILSRLEELVLTQHAISASV
jgi:hypothetical protein